jgi:HEAT repeat protein
MPQSFSQANLRGKSFKGQDLKGTNFSCADIRGANFAHAGNLKNAMQLCLGKEMRKIEEHLRRSQRTRIISLSLILGMMGATIIPALAKGQMVRASERQNATYLAQLTDPPRPVSTLGELINYLNHKDRKVRLWAIQKLGILGPGAKGAVPKLTSFLQDTNAEVRWNSASALGKIGPGAKAAVPKLTSLLQDTDAEVRWNSASAIGKIEPGTKAAPPQLIPLLRDNNASVRQIAAYTLGEIGSEAKAAVPQLFPLLRDGDQSVRLDVILALGKLKSVKETVPQLLPLLQDPDPVTRQATVEILEEFGPATVQKTLPFLIKSYSNYQDSIVQNVIRFELGSEAIVKMIANLHDNNLTFTIPELARTLATIMTSCSEDADYSFGNLEIRKVMILALVANLKDKKSPDRAETASIIGKISPFATSAVPALISALSDQDEGVRRSATDALLMIDSTALRKALIANLQHKDQGIRRTAIESMQLLPDKPTTIPVVPVLRIPCGGGLPSFTHAIRRIFRR